MLTLLLASALGLGVWFVWRALVVKPTESQSREALVRLKAMMEQSGERAKEEKVKVKRPSIFAGMRDRIAGRIERSPKLQGKEGVDLIDHLQKELTLAGLYPRVSPQQAIAIVVMFWGFAVGIAFFAYIGAIPSIIAVMGGLLMMLYPSLKLRAMKKARQEEIRSEVPFFLQELTMALATGALVLDTAIARVAEDTNMIGDRSILADEFRRAVREYQAGGLRREDAIRGVADRCGVQEVSNLVESILTGAEMGMEGLVETLEAYGTQAREQWRNSIREYIAKKEPLITISLVITMFGGLILYAAPLVIRAITTLSGV